MAEYQPGVCNINSEGIKYRRKVAIVAYVLGALLLIIAIALGETVVRIVLATLSFLSLYVGSVNYLQARNSFCVNHGLSGTQRAEEKANKAYQVSDEEALKKDKARSIKMLFQAAAMTVLVYIAIALITFTLFSILIEDIGPE